MNQGEYEGEATIYAHDEVIGLLSDLAGKLLQKKETDFIGKRLHLVSVEDGEAVNILGKKVTLFRYTVNKGKTVWLLHGTGKRLKIDLLWGRTI